MSLNLKLVSRKDYELLTKVEEFVNSRDLDSSNFHITYNAETITLYRLKQRIKGTLQVINREGSMDDRIRKRLQNNLKKYHELVR